VEFTQLIPEPATVDEQTLLASVRDQLGPPLDRPYTLANFVASVDGRATFQGRSGGLGDDGDRTLFHGLREQADAIMAGTITLRKENYGRVLGKAERRERRVQEGLTPEPLACVVTRTGEVPTDIPLFNEPDAQIVVFTPTELPTDRCAAQVEVVVLDPGELTLTTVMRHLYAHHGVRLLLCEGGPTLFAGLLREGLVDELFLTLAPKLTGGGTGPTITSGPELPRPDPAAIRWLLEREQSLYLRYTLNS
jgi:riboflavin-specific deaminase-like protein